MSKSDGDLVVWLVRAGSSDWDEAGRVSGASDLPLCEAGRAEVEGILTRVNGEGLSLIVSGPDEASIATADLLSKSKGGRVKVSEDLGEISLGLWEGLLTSDLESRYPKVWKQWLENPDSVVAPEGESLSESEHRLTEALARMLEKSKGPVAVVLRPLAFGLIGRALSGGSDGAEFWSGVRSECGAVRHVLPRRKLREMKDRSRASV